jgi:protein PhnA
MTQPAHCPECQSTYLYQDRGLWVCSECTLEFNPDQVEDVGTTIKDAHGTILQAGDTVTLIKDLKVKGSSMVLKIGTRAIIKRLMDSDHDLDCKIIGSTDMMLKSEFVKKA